MQGCTNNTLLFKTRAVCPYTFFMNLFLKNSLSFLITFIHTLGVSHSERAATGAMYM